MPILFQFVQYYSLIFSIFVCIYDSEDHFYHWIPVEVPISGLLIEHGPISYKDPSTGLVNVSIETGTHVNWTCYVNGNATEICSNIDLNWENQGGEYLLIHYFCAHDILGIVYFDFVDYKVTGYHDITIEAVNHVTGSTVSDTVTVDVLYMIVNPVIDITTPTWDDFLVHPGDVIRFDVSVDFASRVDVRLLCSDGQNVSITFLLCDLYPDVIF